MKFQLIMTVLVLIVISACALTHSVEAPGFAGQNSIFQAVVTAEVTLKNWPGPENGYLSVLVPTSWAVDNMTFTGPNSGEMSFAFWGIPESGPGVTRNEWKNWMSFVSDSAYVPVEGDIYHISMDIHTNDTLGIFEIAFLAWGFGVMSYPSWDGDPCTTTVQVVELSLENTTWGSVKTQFGNQ